MNKKITLLLVLVMIVTSVGVFSYVASASTNIEICVKKFGSVYIVGPEFRRDECRPQDKLITINTAGGATGPQGPMGEQGPQGIPGPKGDKGDAGEQGPRGDAGIQGEIGPVGPMGLTGPKGDIGERGPVGVDGPQGPAGINGTNGVSGWERVVGQATDVHRGQKYAYADCSAGKKVIGGGYEVISPSDVRMVAINASFPSSDTRWLAVGYEKEGDGYALQAYAICVNAN